VLHQLAMSALWLDVRYALRRMALGPARGAAARAPRRARRARRPAGLRAGDQVVLSDMSRWDGVDRLRIR